MPNEKDVDLSEELAAVFAEMEQDSSTAKSDSDEHTDSNESTVENTKAFATRLKERTDKAVAEERDRIAKELGYQSWSDYEAGKDKKLIEDKGLDPEEVSPVVEEIVKRRISEDPRIKELESYRAKNAQSFAVEELKQLSELTGEQYSSLNQIPKDVIEDWKTSGSLKGSYLKLHGEELIKKARSSGTVDTTSHLKSPNGAPPTPATERLFTDEEKRLYKFFNPSVKDEELNKKTKKI